MLRLSWLVAGLLCAAVAAPQQPPSPPGVQRVQRAQSVSAPQVIEKEQPGYSEEALLAKLQGNVLLALVVGVDGQATDVRVLKSLGLGLDEKAIASVLRWRFDPGMKDGHPVAVAATIEVNFRLLADKRSWYLARASFGVPQGATRPSLVRAPYPAPAGPEQTAAVTLSFDVDEQGVPIHIHVDNSSDPQWEDEVVALIREWRFQAAMWNGSAVVAHGTMDFGRGEVGVPRPPRRLPG